MSSAGTQSRPILHIVGARPNFMKAAPVIDALAARGVPQLLLHTGQHYDDKMSEVFFRDLGIRQPDIDLGVGSGSHAQQTAALIAALELPFVEETPRVVLVYGDVNSTLAAALVATKLQVPLGHVEAGLRSGDRTMPEEVNRLVVDALADLLFVTSADAIAHLAREGVHADKVHFVGNTMIDTLERLRQPIEARAETNRIERGRYAVATLHRPANVDDPAIAKELVGALADIAELAPVVLPLHPRGLRVLRDAGLFEIEGVEVVEPLAYLDFMGLVAGSQLVLTDSGGIQEETTVLGVPCLTLRDNTERPITVSWGTNRLVGRSRNEVVSAAHDILGLAASPWDGRIPPLWDGHAGERIATVVEAWTS